MDRSTCITKKILLAAAGIALALLVIVIWPEFALDLYLYATSSYWNGSSVTQWLLKVLGDFLHYAPRFTLRRKPSNE